MKKTRIRPSALAVSGLMAGSFLLNFLRIGREGFGDKYYAAAVKSMLAGWHNFFFASFDPGGFVSVDKPAPGLWVQTLSASVFGFKGWALILPQALAGAVSVGILYAIVKRAYGVAAGLISALILAITPISVAVNRTNQLDSLLLVVLLVAALAVMIATERSRLRWILVSMALLGLAFNVKMFAAFTVLPSFLLLYFFGSSLTLRQKIGHLSAGVAVLAAVSLSWALAVDLTPKDNRPYVGGSRTNSVLELAVDYNGINRLIPQWLRRGRFGFFRGGRPASPSGGRTNPSLTNPGLSAGPPPAGMAAGGNFPQGLPGMRSGGPFGFETGRAGVLRLFSRQLGGQASWLIVFGLVGAGVVAAGMKKLIFRDRRSQFLLMWAAWFLTLAVYFSTAGFFHRYYLNLIAPAIAALCGMSVIVLWERYRRQRIGGWILPAAIAATAAVQMAVLGPFPEWRHPLRPIILVTAAISLLVLVALQIIGSEGHFPAIAAAAIGLAGLVIAPASWSISAMERGVAASMPAAGPDLGRGPAMRPGLGFGGPGFGGFGEGGGTKRLVGFLEANRTSEKFLLAVPNAMLAWDIILDTGAPVMAMGGFMGSDPILTVTKLESMVGQGRVRYFLVRRAPDFTRGFGALPAGAGPGRGGMFGGEGFLKDLTKWIEEHGTPVPDEVWKDEADRAQERAPFIAWPFFPNLPAIPVRSMMRGALKLYDLRPGSAP